MPKKNGKNGKQGDTEKVASLVSLGYSKAKVQKALKDSGNNLSIAQKILERQVEIASKQEAMRSEKFPPGRSVGTEVGAVDSFLREEESEDNPACVVRGRIKLHPCVVQYKHCKFGYNCILRQFPGDTCINRFNGACVFDDACRNRHYIDGIDVKLLNPAFADCGIDTEDTWEDDADLYADQNQEHNYSTMHEYAGYATGTNVTDSSVVYQPAFTYMGHSSVAPIAEGRKEWDSTAGWGVSKQESAPGPQPFLGLFKSKEGEAISSHATTASAMQGTEVQRLIAREQPQKPVCQPVKAKEKHPCIAQFGDCKYGDMCLHADRDADICVHFLNNRCKFDAGTCKYRHSLSNEPANINQHQTPLPATHERTAPTLPSAPPLPSATASTVDAMTSSPDEAHEPKKNKKKDRLQLKPITGNAPHLQHHRDPAVHSSNTAAGDTTASRLPRSSEAHDRYGGDGASPWAPNAGTAESAEDTVPAEWDDDSQMMEGSNADETTDAEFEAFLQLAEAFPDREPEILLRTLRLHDGNVKAAGDAVACADGADCKEPCDASDEAIAKLLAQAEKEDEERERAERASEDLAVAWTVSSGEAETSEARPCWAAVEETLLTLCSLFPALELTSIEAVLSRCSGDYAEAYKMLLYSTENITRSSYGNFWRDASPVALHRQERLIGMYPDIHPEIVKSCFAAAKQDPKKAGEALNNLTTALLTAEEREDLGRRAVRWDPDRNNSNKTKFANGMQYSAEGQYNEAQGRVRVADTSVSQDEMRALYRDAVKEAQEYGDWRRVRQRALIVKGCQIRTLSLAAEAFVCGDGKAAKTLSLHGKALGRECERLHRLAMLALEAERQDRDPVSTLDLHGFHINEALEVVQRRVKLCVTQRIPTLKIIIGSGRNSAKGKSVVYPEVQSYLTHDATIAPLVRIVSLTPSIIYVRIRKLRADP